MFQIDEKVIADSRTLITIQKEKVNINALVKNGTINYSMADNNLWLTTPKIRTNYLNKKDYISKLDKILLARDGVNIEGTYVFVDPIIFNDNLEVKKDLIVRGNLTVEGNSTIIDTPRLTIEDNIIELNRNENGNGITLKNSGIAINRGSKEFARSLYNETHKAFILETNYNMDADFNINDNKWVTMAYTENNNGFLSGEFRVRYRLTVPFGKFTDSISVANDTSLNKLNVYGASVFNGIITSNNDLTVNGIFTANNNSIFNNLLTANKVANFKDNVNIDKILTVKSTSVFHERTTHKKGILIESLGATITGNSSITGTLNVTENVIFNKDLNVGAKTTTNTLEVLNSSILNTLTVNNTSLLKGATTLNSTLTVKGNTTLENTIINQTLTVNNSSNFNGNVAINNKNLTITSNSNDNGNVIIGGNQEIKKNLTVKGNSTIDGKVVITNGPLEMLNSDIIAKNITTKNDFKVESGDGKGLRFWDNDNYKIYMASTSSTLGGRLDSTSDYNMYFKMSSGTNRGFVFKNNNTNLLQIEGNGQVRVINKIIAKNYEVLTRENEGHKTNATGINSDKLDNLHATDFLRRNVDTDTTGAITFNSNGKAIKFNGGGEIYKNNSIIIKTSNAVTDGVKVITESNTDLLTIKDNTTTGLLFKTHKVFHEGNDGHNSGLDADTLDGKHKEYFATADHLHDNRYIRNDEVNLKGKYKIEYNQEYDSLDFMYMGDTP